MLLIPFIFYSLHIIKQTDSAHKAKYWSKNNLQVQVLDLILFEFALIYELW